MMKHIKGLYFLLWIILFIFILVFFSHYQSILENSNITIVLLNYKRPHNIKYSVPILHSYKHVAEIIIINGLSKYRVEFPHLQKVTQYKDSDFTNDTIGGAIRFFAPCNYDYIVFLDDDHLPSEEYIDKGIHMLKKNPTGLFGNSSRTCAEKYIMRPKKDYNMILTQCMFVHRDTLKTILSKFESYRELLISTRGNGEDIVFNHIYRKIFKKIPILIKPTSKQMIYLDSKSNSYSGLKNHKSTRNKICYDLTHE